MRQNVNTDIIIPIHRLRDVAQAELSLCLRAVALPGRRQRES